MKCIARSIHFLLTLHSIKLVSADPYLQNVEKPFAITLSVVLTCSLLECLLHPLIFFSVLCKEQVA